MKSSLGFLVALTLVVGLLLGGASFAMSDVDLGSDDRNAVWRLTLVGALLATAVGSLPAIAGLLILARVVQRRPQMILGALFATMSLRWMVVLGVILVAGLLHKVDRFPGFGAFAVATLASALLFLGAEVILLLRTRGFRPGDGKSEDRKSEDRGSDKSEDRGPDGARARREGQERKE